MKTIRDFAAAKVAGRKIAMVTAYDAGMARLLADTPVDCVLVGDSVMMVVHGEADTLGATPELMVLHTKAVARGAPGKFIVADMPFLAARKGRAHALDCAAALLRAGASAVKIEGVRGHADVIAHLVESGIPVMGHLGLLPQSVHATGGFRVQAKQAEAAAQLREDAAALVAAGAFAVVLECIPAKLAAELTALLPIPTIGIGASPACDGQILVTEDMVGLFSEFKPKFVRRYAELGRGIAEAGKAYADDVRARRFPTLEHCFGTRQPAKEPSSGG